MRAADDARTATGTAPARAALAGNPSDGYGGAVLAVCLPELEARVTVTRAPATQVEPTGCAVLVAATLARHAAATGRSAGPLRVRVETSIPREVGLAGSSAIVIAALRALDMLEGTSIGRHELPHLALAAEADAGITAGLQDRVAQAYGGLTAMEFPADGSFTARALDPALLPPLVLAWDPGAGSPSGAYHAELRGRWQRGEPDLLAAMERLAAAARAASSAVERGDRAALAQSMDESYDLRASLGRLEPRHVALLETVRAQGFAVNYAGSGGAVVALALPGGPALPALRPPLAARVLHVKDRVAPAAPPRADR